MYTASEAAEIERARAKNETRRRRVEQEPAKRQLADRVYAVFEEQGGPVSHTRVSVALPDAGPSAVRTAVTTARACWRQTYGDSAVMPDANTVLSAVRTLLLEQPGSTDEQILATLRDRMPLVTIWQVKRAATRVRNPERAAARHQYGAGYPIWDATRRAYVFLASGKIASRSEVRVIGEHLPNGKRHRRSV